MKQHHDTHSKILREAKALFAKQDFEATSMAEIAKKVGIEKASLYYFFADKESILAAVIEDIWGNVSRTLAEKHKNYVPLGTKTLERKYFSSVLLFILDAFCEGGLVLTKLGSKEIKQHPAYKRISGHVATSKKLLNSYLRYHHVRTPDIAEEIIANATFSYVMHAQYGKPTVSKTAYTQYLASLFI